MEMHFIMLHGYLGIDKITLFGKDFYYFNGVNEYLHDTKIGQVTVKLHFPRVPALGSIKERAYELNTYIGNLDISSFHLIGHSMGGLDGRYYTTYLDHDKRVKSLTTIATPHRGSSLADDILNSNGLRPLILKSLSPEAVESFTREGAKKFNIETPDREDVNYHSYGGVRPEIEMPLKYKSWTKTLETLEGANDNQVPFSSTKWGKTNDPLRADHFEMVGWNLGLPNKEIGRPFDHLKFYKKIITELIKEFN